MKVFRNYTLRSLLRSRTRTLVTLIGIILSMALFTAVIEAVYSARCYLIAMEEEVVGPWNGAAFSALGNAAALEDDRIARTASIQFGGTLELGEEDDRQTVMLGAIADAAFPEMVVLTLSRGRLPENDKELLLPAQYSFGLEPGDTVRAEGGKTLTVTGIISGISSVLNQFLSGSPYGLTGPGGGILQAIGPKVTFFELKDPARYLSFIEDHPELGDRVLPNVELLSFYGALPDRNIMAIFQSIAAVLVFLIVLGSVSLIYNSFAISVTERTRQYGILKSIGATKFQVGYCVIFEALVLCVIGIPAGMLLGCAGIGITLFALRDAFASMFWGETSAQMKLVISVKPLLLSAAICLVTTLAAAFIPSVRAIRISPMEAIRQTKDIRLRAKSLKVNPLVRKLFGFSGTLAAKSMKRNRRQYRAITISLFLSIVLFVGASSFCDNLEETTKSASAMNPSADLIARVTSEDPEELDSLKKELEGIPGVTGVTYAADVGERTYLPVSVMDESLSRTLNALEEGGSYAAPAQIMGNDVEGLTLKEEYFYYRNSYTDVPVAFVDDESFRAILAGEGLPEEEFFDASEPKGIMHNQTVLMDYNWEKRSSQWYLYKVVDEKKLPAEAVWVLYREIEGYGNMGTYTDPEGTVWYAYVADEDLDTFLEGSEQPDFVPDWSMAKLLTPEEAKLKQSFVLSAATKADLSTLPSGQFTMLYPYSMMSSVLDPDFARTSAGLALSSVSFGVNTKGYLDVEEEVTEILKRRYPDYNTDRVQNVAQEQEQVRMLILVVRVFSYGFIILIALIAAANVFNTISTGIMLRRREFAMLKSIGLSDKGVLSILNYECLLCGLRAVITGLPVSVLVCWFIYDLAFSRAVMNFIVPVKSMIIVTASVFLVVFASMLYAAQKLKKDNVIEVIKREV